MRVSSTLILMTFAYYGGWFSTVALDSHPASLVALSVLWLGVGIGIGTSLRLYSEPDRIEVEGKSRVSETPEEDPRGDK